MTEQHDEHCFERAWFLVNWYARYRWACSMRLALVLLIVVGGKAFQWLT